MVELSSSHDHRSNASQCLRLGRTLATIGLIGLRAGDGQRSPTGRGDNEVPGEAR